MKWQFLAVVPVVLAACVAEPPPLPDPVPFPAEDACGAAGLQGLVGQSESALAAMTFPHPMRLLRPGMAVTMEYSPERLNIELDAAGKIIRVSCG